MSCRFHVGVAGWSIRPEHRALFAPDGSHLERYASRYPSVEINSSFYRLHKPATYAKWAEAVPPQFSFAVKAPKLLTHERKLLDTGPDLTGFLREAAGLGPKPGCVLVQLPPSLAYDPRTFSITPPAARPQLTPSICCRSCHLERSLRMVFSVFMSSEFRVEKRREAAELTLSTGATVAGYFFLAGSSGAHSGPERVGDVLNVETGFFPFEAGDGDTALYNRAQVVMVSLPTPVIEAQLDAGYDVATRRTVKVLLTSGATVTGSIVVYRPQGRDRLSDYAAIDERFRYLELPDRTVLINSAHIVALTEVRE